MRVCCSPLIYAILPQEKNLCHAGRYVCSGGPKDLDRNHRFVAPGKIAQRAPHHFFAGAEGIHIGRIKWLGTDDARSRNTHYGPRGVVRIFITLRRRQIAQMVRHFFQRRVELAVLRVEWLILGYGFILGGGRASDRYAGFAGGIDV